MMSDPEELIQVLESVDQRLRFVHIVSQVQLFVLVLILWRVW